MKSISQDLFMHILITATISFLYPGNKHPHVPVQLHYARRCTNNKSTSNAPQSRAVAGQNEHRLHIIPATANDFSTVFIQ